MKCLNGFLVARSLAERDLLSHYGVCGSVDRDPPQDWKIF